MGIVDRIRSRINHCQKCKGKVFFTNKAEEVKRCSDCFADELFIYRLKIARVNEGKIKPEYLPYLKYAFRNSITVALDDINMVRRSGWAHTAVTMFIKLGLRAAFFSDKDVQDGIFNRAGEEEGTPWMDKFSNPEFLALEIGTMVNSKVLAPNIMSIIADRERNNKFTLITFPSIRTVMDLYKHDELVYFLSSELRYRDPKAYFIIPRELLSRGILE